MGLPTKAMSVLKVCLNDKDEIVLMKQKVTLLFLKTSFPILLKTWYLI